MAFANDHEIASIIEACRLMGSDKITERRKNAELLEKLLFNDRYLSLLDANSDNAAGFTWNDMFRAASSYMSKEAEKFKSDESKGIGASQAQKTLRGNQLQQSTHCLLNVIVLASKRKPRLDVDLVLDHCLIALKDPFWLEKFGMDHLTALNREILSRRSYWSKLKPNLWLSIFLMGLKILRSSMPANLTYVAVSTLLNNVIRHGTLQCDITLKVIKKMPVLIASLNNKAMLVKEHNLVKLWLDSAIHLSFSVGFEDRLLLCNLTESTINTFLDLCYDHREDMDRIVQYAILAVVAHHPNGDEVSEPGFRVSGAVEAWKNILRKLHSVTDFAVKMLHLRNRTSENPIYHLSDDQVMLAVRVARQIFSSSTDYTLDVTRLGVLDDTEAPNFPFADGPSAKRKRLMSGFSELISRLKEMGPTNESIPWIQIATELVSEYPTFPQTHEMKELLDFAVDVTSHGCREYEMVSHCFRLFRSACTALFECRHDHKDLLHSSIQPDTVAKLWDSVWKCIAAHQCHQEGFLLLATLLHYRLVSGALARQLIQQIARPDRSIPCDRHSVLCLAAYLERFKFPDRIPVRNGGWSSDLDGERSVRSLISEWLLTCQHCDTDILLPVFHALAMKQPAIQQLDLAIHLAHLHSPNHFELKVRRLESTFCYVGLLEQQPSRVRRKPPDTPQPALLLSPTALEEELALLGDACLRTALLLEEAKQINSELLPSLASAVRLLCLVFSRDDPESARLVSGPAGHLLRALLFVVLQEESVYSRRFLKRLADELFGSQVKLYDGPARLMAWTECIRKLKDVSAGPGDSENVFGTVRRGSASMEPAEIEQFQQESQEATSSLLDPSVLKESDAWLMELHSLLAVICCPSDGKEALKPEYGRMKAELFTSLSSQENPDVDLQISVRIVRQFGNSPLGTLDGQLINGIVDLVTRVGQHYIYDHEAAIAVLDLLPQLARHISASGCPYSKSKFVSLLVSYQIQLGEDVFGPLVEQAFYRCLAGLSAVAADFWLEWSAGSLEPGKRTSMPLEVLAGLNRPLNSVAVRTSQVVRQLFDGTSSIWWNAVLSSISSFIGDHLQDVDSPRSTVILQALSSFAVQSAWAEKPILVLLLRFAQKHRLDTQTVQRVLEMTAQDLGLDYFSWMESRLGFLMDRWLDLNELDEFPYALYHCKTLASFVQKYQNVIAPLVFLKKDPAKLAQVTEQLTARNAVFVLTKVLPNLSSSQPDHFARNKYRKLQESVSERDLRQALENGGLCQLVAGLLFSIHDAQLACHLFGMEVMLPALGSFRFNKQTALESIERFHPDGTEQQEPFGYFVQQLKSRPSDLHVLLVDLYAAYESGCRLTDKQQALVSLYSAVDLLVRALLPGELALLEYAVYSMVFRLGHIIRKEEANASLRLGALVILKELLTRVIVPCPAIVAKLLVTIIGYVTPLAARESGQELLSASAMTILESLLDEHREKVKDALAQLSQFPALPQFARLNGILEDVRQGGGSLEQQIEAFLRLVEELDHNVPVESIQELARLLGSRKEDLKELYAGTDSTLPHRLVCCLVRLTRTKSTAHLEAVAAALGELGPADLATLILQPDLHVRDIETPLGKMETYSRDHPLFQLPMAVFPLLVRYLLSAESVELVGTAGQVMLEALNHIEGQVFYKLAKNYRWPSMNLLVPFRIEPKEKAQPSLLLLNSAYFKDYVDDATLWIPAVPVGHSAWLTRLTCSLIRSFVPSSSNNNSPGCFYSVLLPVCQLVPEFCSALLPHVVQSILTVCHQDERRILSARINAALDSSTGPNPSLKTLLEVVQHLRQHQPKVAAGKAGESKWNCNFRLELNYLQAARASQSLSAYFSTIMYAEIWLDRLNRIGHPEDSNESHPAVDNTGGYRRADQVYDLLVEAYTSTGEPDGRSGFLLPSDPGWDIRHYEQENQWFQSLESRDALASYVGSSAAAVQQTPGMLTALARCGLYRTVCDLAGNVGYHSGEPSMAAIREYQFECGWRLADWSQHQKADSSGSEEAPPGFQQLLYGSLLALKNNDQPELIRNLSDARLLVVDQLSQAGSLESCRNIYPALTSLRLIRDVEDIGLATQLDRNGVQQLKAKWAQCDQLPVVDFAYREPSLALRSVVLKEFFTPGASTTAILVETLLQSCRQARQHGNFSIAGRCLAQLTTLLDEMGMENQDWQLECRIEKALTEWSRKDVDRALSTLRFVAQALERSPSASPNSRGALAKVLGLLGQWLHDTRSENPRQILTDYFQKSLKTLEGDQRGSGQDPASVSEARQRLASYADSLYKDVKSYIESREFETQQKLAGIRQGRAKELTNLKPGNNQEANAGDLRRAKMYLTNETANDMAEFKTLFQERDSFLLQAVENYLAGIREESALARKDSQKFDVRISRLISLWFDNRCNEQLTQLLLKWLPKLPSYHFVPVLPQLAARLVVKSNPQLYHDEFPKLLLSLVERCALDHPHHTLPVVLALAMTNRDTELLARGRGAANHPPEEERVTAAKNIVQKVMRSEALGSRCARMEQLAGRLIELANKDVAVSSKADAAPCHKLPIELVNSAKDLEDVPVPTVTVPIRPDGAYGRVVGIQSFEPEFCLVGGLNAPKKMSCRGTDGILRPMLLKGKDDLRQDSVMQQVFTTMNTFLQQDEEARRRRLRIRTYKVVPLSKRSGILEWCQNTMPIGSYLVGNDNKSGAHLRYHQPGDLTTRESNDRTAELKDKFPNLKDRYAAFDRICARFPPVFRHFFLERYPAPSLWFEKRLSYTRSAAASSMVGYILGLGDRHLSNILIDETTAELIHIDLGIAFDQGAVLPVPETVPFRLTRDIVDGMGVMGVEGTFRKCCEFTMEVMRKNQDSILTLLEVLLYDPLYVWTVTAQKAAAVQQPKRSLSKRGRGSAEPVPDGDEDGGDSQVNESAKRTLVRLSQKLKGVEKGTPLSVSGQVNLLIQQARDPANLARLWHGWKPQA